MVDQVNVHDITFGARICLVIVIMIILRIVIVHNMWITDTRACDSLPVVGTRIGLVGEVPRNAETRCMPSPRVSVGDIVEVKQSSNLFG